LEERDADGNTPLHLAVRHEHFADADNSLSLVKELAEKCLGAFMIVNRGEKKLTPFLYLQESRRSFKESRSTDSKSTEQKATEAKSMVDPGARRPQPPPGPATPGTLPKKTLNRVSSIGPESNTKAVREPEKPEHRRKKKVKKAELSDDQVVLIFTRIEKFLKKYILQNFSHSDALKILYGPVAGMFRYAWPR
jgi:hypothetical protein